MMFSRNGNDCTWYAKALDGLVVRVAVAAEVQHGGLGGLRAALAPEQAEAVRTVVRIVAGDAIQASVTASRRVREMERQVRFLSDLAVMAGETNDVGEAGWLVLVVFICFRQCRRDMTLGA